ncbi:threonine aldolase family protein [Streptomyces sp. NPDC002067]
MRGNTRHDHDHHHDRRAAQQPDRHAAPTAAPGAEPAVGDRQRRLSAAHGAKRTLAARPQTLRERLDGLLADAPGVCDLDTWPDMYGNDDSVIGELERRTADALGAEAAAFFPTGTMAQQVALRCWAGRTGNATVAGHPLSHMEVHERDAYATVSGLRMVHPTDEPRTPTAAEIHALQEPFGTLALELPLRDAGFVLPGWEELTATVEAARERDAVVHFDGARIWECAPHFGRGLPEIAALADSVYVSFYKSLGGIGGAALVGSESFIEETRAWRHRYGGQLFQQWPTALTALAGLDGELPRLPAYVAQAKVVAQALTEALAASPAPWFRVHPRTPHTHQFRLWLPYPAQTLNEAGLRQTRETGTSLFTAWFDDATPGLATTEVTVQAPALEWTADDIRAALADFVARTATT